MAHHTSPPVAKIFFWVFLFWLGGLAGYFLTNYFIFHSGNFIGIQNLDTSFPDTQEFSSSSKHFFSDDIMILAYDQDGVPLFLRFDLNRKQLQSTSFIHYYWADLFYKDTRKNQYVSFIDHQPDVSTRQLFSRFEHQPFPDLSPRERYDFSFDLEGKNLQIMLEGLSGDFLVRNTLEQTKYVSLGVAKIVMDGQNFDGVAMVAKIYSDDYSKYIFFDGFEILETQTHYLVLWDEIGNFYLIDTTKAENENYDYKSHTWVLYKNMQGDFVRKVFSVEIDLKKQGVDPARWDLKIPDLFDSSFQLSPLQFLTDDHNEGLVHGTILNGDGKKMKVLGFFKELMS